MSASEPSDTSTSLSNPKKRGNETENEDDSPRPAKKQKTLSEEEKLGEDLRKNAEKLKSALAQLNGILKRLALSDNDTDIVIERIARICDEISRKNFTRRATSLKLLKEPFEYLSDAALSGVKQRKS